MKERHLIQVREEQIQHAECNRTFYTRKVQLSKKTEKNYTVTVTYIAVSEEEAKIKRAIIESIVKKPHK